MLFGLRYDFPYVRYRTDGDDTESYSIGGATDETLKSHSFARTFQIRKSKMLYTIAVILIVLWLLGLVSSYTMGGFIHVLLVVALVVIVIQVIQGRRG